MDLKQFLYFLNHKYTLYSENNPALNAAFYTLIWFSVCYVKQEREIKTYIVFYNVICNMEIYERGKCIREIKSI